MIAVDGIPIKTYQNIKDAVSQAKQKLKKEVKIEFGSLVGFVMSGEGIPLLQADQLNEIAHHIHSTFTGKDLWPKKQNWPQKLDIAK